MNLSKFRKLLETKESVEELQNKITFLNTQLSIRDDEIKHVLINFYYFIVKTSQSYNLNSKKVNSQSKPIRTQMNKS